MEDSLHERGKAMEDLFFKQTDEKLLKNMRHELAAKEMRDALHEASGISDKGVLDELIGAGITPDSLTSIAMVPLVVVAWADKVMERSEKAAILQAAEDAGIKTGTASYTTLESWLNKKPSSELLDAWKAYIVALKPTLDGAAYTQLKHSIVGRAEKVATAAGGFLGIGNKVSEVERKALDDLASTFD
jgi:hypothetical protein